MPSLHERTRNNVRAGIFVIVAILLAAGTVIALSNVWETLVNPRQEYTVIFKVEEGVKNLKEGSEVRVGGVLMGRVESVTARTDEPDAVLSKIEVIFALDKDVLLYGDAVIMVTPALIGGDAKLDIYSVGTVAEGPAQDTELDGSSAPGITGALLGPGKAQKAGEMIDNAALFVEDLRETGGDIKALASRIRNEDWPRWAKRVDHIMEWSASATEQLDEIFAQGNGLLTDAREVVAENREPIRNTVTNVEEVTGRLRTETVDKLHRLLDTGQEGLDQATAVLEEARRDYEIWATDITDALANARQVAQQLKLTMIEVRRSPWKLLHRPSRQEQEHELLYASTRAFALAASDLKAASASVQRMLDSHGDEIREDPATFQLLNDYLIDSVERYGRAQQQLIDVLLTE